MYLLIQQVFDVYSCHVCPGGCKFYKPIMNSLLLTVEVAVPVGVISSVIALFLLIVIIILVYKLRKRLQYHQL